MRLNLEAHLFVEVIDVIFKIGGQASEIFKATRDAMNLFGIAEDQFDFEALKVIIVKYDVSSNIEMSKVDSKKELNTSFDTNYNEAQTDKSILSSPPPPIDQSYYTKEEAK
jgi:hypothetical protein